jgi:predicted acylesterase/phospholipase RssA
MAVPKVQRHWQALSDPSFKLGLGLSGGGFRASFFHIGVLRRLAELDRSEFKSCA